MTNNWARLDNAAKIFPSAESKTNTNVFRLSCDLTEKIDPPILQEALDDTVKRFELFRSVLKRGLFWYYLEHMDYNSQVRKDNKLPCTTIYTKSKHKLLFRVSYYEKRINFEVYHVLTDGTGALNFFKTLVVKYLSKKYKISEPQVDYDASEGQMADDSFLKYYNSEAHAKREKLEKACILRGTKYPEDRMRIITGRVDVKKTLEAAHRYNTTLTVYLTACMMEAINANMSVYAKKRPIVIAVPVNFRKYFPSETARNFFGVVYIGYDFKKKSGEFEDVIKTVRESLDSEINRDSLADKINSYMALERNVFARILPLPLKNIILRIAYKKTMSVSTATLSNVGKITVDAAVSQYIEGFDIATGTGKIQACLCTYNGKLSVGFTSPFVSTDIQRHFFRTLAKQGIEVEISSNFDDD